MMNFQHSLKLIISFPLIMYKFVLGLCTFVGHVQSINQSLGGLTWPK